MTQLQQLQSNHTQNHLLQTQSPQLPIKNIIHTPQKNKQLNYPNTNNFDDDQESDDTLYMQQWFAKYNSEETEEQQEVDNEAQDDDIRQFLQEQIPGLFRQNQKKSISENTDKNINKISQVIGLHSSSSLSKDYLCMPRWEKETFFQNLNEVYMQRMQCQEKRSKFQNGNKKREKNDTKSITDQSQKVQECKDKRNKPFSKGNIRRIRFSETISSVLFNKQEQPAKIRQTQQGESEIVFDDAAYQQSEQSSEQEGIWNREQEKGGQQQEDESDQDMESSEQNSDSFSQEQMDCLKSAKKRPLFYNMKKATHLDKTKNKFIVRYCIKQQIQDDYNGEQQMEDIYDEDSQSSDNIDYTLYHSGPTMKNQKQLYGQGQHLLHTVRQNTKTNEQYSQESESLSQCQSQQFSSSSSQIYDSSIQEQQYQQKADINQSIKKQQCVSKAQEKFLVIDRSKKFTQNIEDKGQAEELKFKRDRNGQFVVPFQNSNQIKSQQNLQQDKQHLEQDKESIQQYEGRKLVHLQDEKGEKQMIVLKEYKQQQSILNDNTQTSLSIQQENHVKPECSTAEQQQQKQSTIEFPQSQPQQIQIQVRPNHYKEQKQIVTSIPQLQYMEITTQINLSDHLLNLSK